MKRFILALTLLVCSLVQGHASPTEQPEEGCSDFHVDDACCDDGCFWMNCTKEAGSSVPENLCLNSTTEGLPANCLTATDQCSAVMDNTTVPPMTTEAAGETTVLPEMTTTRADITSHQDPSTGITGHNDSTTFAPTAGTAVEVTTSDAAAPTNRTTDQTTERMMTTQDTAQGGNCGGRHFDAASFVGGMVFVAGLAAIGGFIYKYVRSRDDPNYHTL